MKENKVKVPISLEIFLLSVVPLLIVAVVSSLLFYNSTVNSIRRTTLQLAQTSTDKLSAEVNALLTQYYEKVKNLANLGAVAQDTEIMYNAASSFAVDLPESLSIYYATAISRFQEGGFYVDSSDWEPPLDWNPEERDWYKNAVASPRKITLTTPYIDAMTNSLCISISQTSTNDEGTLLGVASADLILDALSKMVNEYKISESSSSYLVESHGMYLTHKDSNKLMKDTIFDDYLALQNQKDILVNDAINAVIKDGKYFAISPIKGTPWFAVATGNVSDFTSSVLDTIWMLLVLMGVQVVVVLIVALVFSRLISKTFTSMVEHCNSFSKGDFTAHFEDYFIKEADSLAKGFEAFSQNIRMLVGKIFKSAKSVSDMAISLNQASDSIKTAVSDAVAAISQMGTTSTNQTAAVQQVDDAVNEIVDEAQQLSKEIDSQNQIISYSSASIEEIVQSMNSVHVRINDAATHVEELVKLASENKNAVSQATKNIVNVRQESASLQEMNNVISSVAAQTNLLAMNAAIEAAHAGAAGKGFAVVADEIRKLAETAAKQANSSSTYLKAIQSKIDGIAESAVSIDKSFDGTLQRINDISQVVTQLEQATGEQEMLSGQVLQALSNIQSSTHNITTNVSGITASTSQTSQLCHRLRDLNNDVNTGITSCKKASTEMQNASMTINVVANSTQTSVAELLEAVSSFRVERRSGNNDRRQKSGVSPEGGERRASNDRRKNHIDLTPPKIS